MSLLNAETQLCKIIVVFLLTLMWQKQCPCTQLRAVDRKPSPVPGRASFCPAWDERANHGYINLARGFAGFLVQCWHCKVLLMLS